MNCPIHIVLAMYKIPDESFTKFLKWNKTVFEQNQVSVIFVSDRNVSVSCSYAKVLVYPVEQKIFSIGKTINYGIRHVEEDSIIIKTDPDIVFTDAVLKHILNKVSPKQGMVCICSDINTFENISSNDWTLAKKRTQGKGACLAMHKSDWFDLNGYDERIEGWGGDDTDMYRRASAKISFLTDCTYPLYHIKHGKRITGEDGHFPFRSKQNLQIGKPMNWKNQWWGNPMKVNK